MTSAAVPSLGLKTLTWIKEIWWRIVKPLYSLMYMRPPAHYLTGAPGKPAIILLPGVANRWSSNREVAEAISRAGYPVHIIMELGTNMQLIEDTAHIVRSYILAHDLREVILVGHSKGGLVGKYYLLHENADGRVRGVVALAAPFHGSIPAKISNEEPFKEMHPGSEILRALASDPSVDGRIVCIYSRYDTHVLIPGSSYLEGALEDIELPMGGHNALLHDRRSLQATIHAIERIAENAPQSAAGFSQMKGDYV